MVEPLSAASAALGAYRLGSGLVERFRGRNEIANLFKTLGKELRQDHRIPAEHRDALARDIDGLRVDPYFLGGLSAYLDDAQADVLGPLKARIVDLYADRAGDFGMTAEEIAGLVVEHIERDAWRAKPDDRSAAHLDALLLRGEVRTGLAEVRDELRRAQAAQQRVIVAAGLPSEGIERALALLGEECPEQFGRVEGLIGANDSGERAAELIPPALTDDGLCYPVLVVYARYAEQGGYWNESSLAWERVSQLREGHAPALVNAAVAAGVPGQEDRRIDLLERARAIDPREPKLLLEEVGAVEDPGGRLELLEGLEADDDQVAALIECHRALAYLELDQVEEAARRVERAERLGPKMVQVRTVAVNLTIHRARLAMLADQPFDEIALLDAQRRCLSLREELIPQARWQESGRLLMLAMDCASLLHDKDFAAELASRAITEEIDAAGGAAVLAEAALRGGHWGPALRFVEGGPDNDETRRIAATARLALGEDGEAAQTTLEALAVGDGPEAESAALALLAHAGLRDGEWSEIAEGRLLPDHAVMVLTLKALHAARDDYAAAKSVVAAHRDEPWAIELLFYLASRAGEDEAVDLAREVITTNPARWVRLDCARVLFEAGARAEAETQARIVADDRAASPSQRSDAYNGLLLILEAENRWPDARKVLGDWSLVDPTDERLNGWQVRVGNRLRRHR
jgi:tetratricopeptide (TPR) repeat protein